MNENILVVVADDIGADAIRAYDAVNIGYETTLSAQDLEDLGIYAAMPNLEEFAGASIKFHNARVNPLCGPTRAGLYSGRYSSRTGVGHLVTKGNAGDGLCEFGVDVAVEGDPRYVPRREYVLAEFAAAAGYRSAFFGKWHLALMGVDPSVDSKNVAELVTLPNGWIQPPSGWAHLDIVGRWDHWFAVQRSIGSPPQPYDGNLASGSYGVPSAQGENGGWYGREKGDLTTTLYNGPEQYADKVKIAKALAWMNDPANQPWVCVICLHQPHAPFHDPRPAGYSVRPVYTNLFDAGQTNAVLAWALYGGMREAFDQDFGNLINGLDPAIRANTMILATGDNGCEPGIMLGAAELYDDNGEPVVAYYQQNTGAKGSIYDPGVRVPLFVQGPLCVGAPRTSQALVDVHVDLLRTCIDIMGGSYSAVAGAQPCDSVSFLPLLQDPGLGLPTHARKAHFHELFTKNGFPAAATSRERAYVRILRLPEVSLAPGLYKLIRRLQGGVDVEEFYRMGNSSAAPQSADYLEQTNLIGNTRASQHLAICRAEMDALIASF